MYKEERYKEPIIITVTNRIKNAIIHILNTAPILETKYSVEFQNRVLFYL